MSRASSDDQLKFLLSCVKHSNNGKIDFIEVAQECGVVSKGAAAKRYERLMKSNGINPNGGPDPKPHPPSAHRVQKNRGKSNTARQPARQPAKRRKVESAAVRRKDSMAQGSKAQAMDDNRVDRRRFCLAADFPISAAPQNSHDEPMQNDECLLDFNEFCSPEMFANCATETRHPSPQVVPSPPPPEPHTVPAFFSYAQPNEAPPASNKEALRVIQHPERETVIIAD